MELRRTSTGALDWLRLFPALLIFRALRLAISPGSLAIGYLATLLMMLATWSVGFVMLSPEEAKATKDDRYRHVLTARLSGSVGESLKQIEVAYSKNFLVLFNEPIKGEANWRQHLKMGIAHCSVVTVSLVLASILGGMICRRSLAQLAGDEAPPLASLVDFVKQKWVSLITAPLYPLVGIFLLFLITYPVSWLMLSKVGVWIVALSFPLLLLLGVAGAILSLGTYLGWPLFLPAIAAERDADAFDAFGRAFSYVLGRPLHVLLCIALLALGSIVGTSIVDALVNVVNATLLGFFSGNGDGVFSGLLDSDQLPAAQENRLINFWLTLLRQLPEAYRYSYFWCAASAMYLVMRQEVDGKAMDEIARDDDPRPQPPRPKAAESATSGEESDQPVIDNT
ncbi:MAG: hypothetical protein ACO1RA_19610 [Planctomycetaceae bacterium]